MSEMREDIHATVPPEVREEATMRRNELTDAFLEMLECYLKDVCVGKRNARSQRLIAKALDQYEQRGRRTKRLTGALQVLIGRGVPICTKQDGKIKDKGVYVGVTTDEIKESVAYRRKMVSGALNSADALEALHPYNPESNGTQEKFVKAQEDYYRIRFQAEERKKKRQERRKRAEPKIINEPDISIT